MRRSLVLTFSLLLVLVGLSPPAEADSTVVQRGLTFPSDGFTGLAATSCSATPWVDPLSVNAQGRYAYTDDPANALGTSKLGFTYSSGGQGAVGPYAYTPNPGTAGTFDIRINVTNSVSQGYAVVYFFSAADASNGSYWVGTAPITQSPNGWYTVDAESLSMDWHHYNMGTGAFDATVNGQTRTAFVAGHGGDGDGAFLGFTFGCDGGVLSAPSTYFDRLRVGTPGNVTTYDFEGLLTKTTIAKSASTITAGGSVILKGVTTGTDGQRLGSAKLTLEKKAYGASAWSVVNDNVVATYNFETDHQTPATLTVSPTRQTSYRWRYPATPAGSESVSPYVTIGVRTKVTIVPTDLTVKKNKYLVIAGGTTPPKPGAKITLQRKVSGVWKTWATVNASTTGKYRLVKQMTTTGRWRIRTVASAGTGNLTGYSAEKVLTVYP